MKRIENIVVILLQFLVIVSCTKNVSKEYINDLGQSVYEVFYSNDQLKSRTTYLNSQRTEYTLINYYEDGILKDSAFFMDGVVDGMRTLYEKDKGLFYEEHYSNGLLNGTHKAIYSNGVSSFDGYRKNGRMAGSWNFHYPSGLPITYEFYDSTGVLMYFRKYTEEGLPESTNGDGIISIPSLTENIYAGSKLDLKLLIAMPPKCESDLIVTVHEPGGKSISVFNEAVLNEVLIIPYTFTRAGAYRFLFELEVRSAKGSSTENYSQEKSFTIL